MKLIWPTVSCWGAVSRVKSCHLPLNRRHAPLLSTRHLVSSLALWLKYLLEVLCVDSLCRTKVRSWCWVQEIQLPRSVISEKISAIVFKMRILIPSKYARGSVQSQIAVGVHMAFEWLETSDKKVVSPAVPPSSFCLSVFLSFCLSVFLSLCLSVFLTWMDGWFS